MLKVCIIFLKEDKVLGFCSMAFPSNLRTEMLWPLGHPAFPPPSALARVLQRNRPIVRVCVCMLIYYKQRGPCNYGSSKSQDLKSSVSHWGPRRADGVILVQVWRQEKANVPTQRQSGRRSFPLLEGGSAFLFYSGLQLIRYGPPTESRTTLN